VGAKRKLIWALGALIALCGSCGKPQNGGAGSDAQEVGAQRPAIADEQILAEVKKAFAADPDLRKETIEVTVKDGRVTLVGFVSSGEVRIRAEDKVRSQPEVFGVDAEKLIVK